MQKIHRKIKGFEIYFKKCKGCEKILGRRGYPVEKMTIPLHALNDVTNNLLEVIHFDEFQTSKRIEGISTNGKISASKEISKEISDLHRKPGDDRYNCFFLSFKK